MDIQERLKAGLVCFVYAKTSGEERFAFGTLREDLIPADKNQLLKFKQGLEVAKEHIGRIVETMGSGSDTPIEEYKGALEGVLADIEDILPKPKEKSKKGMSESLQIYYDFEVQGFRSFKKDQLIRIVA